MELCKKCVCRPVCEIFRATGGVGRCKHYYSRSNISAYWVVKWHIDPNGDFKLYHCSNCDTPCAQMRRHCSYCGSHMGETE